MKPLQHSRHLRVLIFVVWALLLPVGGVSATDDPIGPPPNVGATWEQDRLTSMGALLPLVCGSPSGPNRGEFVGEGYIIKVRGRCSPTDEPAITLPTLDARGFLNDGEYRLEMKAVSGHELAVFGLIVRARAGSQSFGGYRIEVEPAHGRVALVKFDGARLPGYFVGRTKTWLATEGGMSPEIPALALESDRQLLAERDDLGELLHRDDWNTIAVRLRGPKIWVLVNDEPLLGVTDSTFDSGAMLVRLERTGNPESTEESAVVIRNYRLARLASD